MLGETGRQVMGPIRGSGDFLAYGSPSISALATAYLGNELVFWRIDNDVTDTMLMTLMFII